MASLDHHSLIIIFLLLRLVRRLIFQDFFFFFLVTTMVAVFHNINFINVNSILTEEKRDTYRIYKERENYLHIERHPLGLNLRSLDESGVRKSRYILRHYVSPTTSNDFSEGGT